MLREHALRSHRGSGVEGQQRARRERELGMAQDAEQHGRRSAPVNGEYHRMEDGDRAQRFKNKMRLNILGKEAWLEVPKRKSRRTVTLRLTEEGCDAVTIDWRPAHPDWYTSRLQLAVVGGERGLLENEENLGSSTKSIRRRRWSNSWRQRGTSPGRVPLPLR